MTTKPNIQIGDESREMTDAEHAQHQKDVAADEAATAVQAATDKAQVAAKTSAHTKLAALGLTADEIAALTGAN